MVTATVLLLTSSTVLAQKQLSLLATLSDPAGRQITSVDSAAVTVYEDGKPLKVSSVETVERVPKLQVLIDNGIGFPSTNLSDLRTAVKGLLTALPGNVEVTMVTTAPSPRFLEKGTTDRVKLLAAADRITPDDHAGKFIDSLYEAAQRANRDPLETAVPTILTIGTTVGDAHALESDMNKALEWIRRKEIPVHVVLLSNVATNTGGVQIDLGQAASRIAGGRMEVINTAIRLISLMPEVGRSLAASLGGGRWIRVTAERSGERPLGGIGMSVKGLTVDELARDNARTK